MLQIFSHTFIFSTPDSLGSNTMFENIISITEEDAKKHYVQYMQYRTEVENSGNKVLKFKQVHLKVDRTVYLEIANIAIDEKTRRQKFFNVLGRRRFGANDEKLNCYYLRSDIDTKAVAKEFRQFLESTHPTPIVFEKKDNNLNRYEAYSFEYDEGFFVYLIQENISNRKRIEKTFIVEMIKEDYDVFIKKEGIEEKISYIFNKIGKIYFKSLEDEMAELPFGSLDTQEIAESLVQKGTKELERSSIIHNNNLFQLLKQNQDEIESYYFNLYSKGIELINHPENDKIITFFSTAVVSFVNQFRKVEELEEIVSHLTALYLFAEDGKLDYILEKADPDFKDIFLYMLECLTDWNNSLSNTQDGAYRFNIATIDFQNALKYLLDTYFIFNHEYHCHDILVEEKMNVEIKSDKTTSASAYLAEVLIDTDVYEEFLELEDGVDCIHDAEEIDEKIRESLISFFKGYTNLLNTLFEFKDIGYSLSLLSMQLEKADLHENNKILLMLMQGLVSDLLEWKNTVFIEKDAIDIHYMDKSFYSNIAQTEILLDSSKGYDDEIEFF